MNTFTKHEWDQLIKKREDHLSCAIDTVKNDGDYSSFLHSYDYESIRYLSSYMVFYISVANLDLGGKLYHKEMLCMFSPRYDRNTVDVALNTNQSINKKPLSNIFQKGDIIIGSLDVRSAREERVSFSTTILDSSVSLLLQKPPATPTFFQFLWPFTWELWMRILLVFFIVGGALFLMGRYDSTQKRSEQRFDLKESLWYSLNVLLQGISIYKSLSQYCCF